MVAKKVVIRLMEEFLGEYIINISKENLKVAVLRGKIKLENVQLDGDLIGSHILSAVGLSGFAVLSCTAEKLRANIPWGRLEKEPTTFQLTGLQLICVPLLPSNASRIFGSGTKVDPRCTLRTRVKRAAIARFERNFFSWRIPGEGPPRPERNRTKRRRGRRREHSVEGMRGGGGNNMDGDKSVIWDEQSIAAGSFFTIDGQDDISYLDDGVSVNDGSPQKEFSDVQKIAWRDKLVNKLFRNIELSITDVHIRCEVCEGALDTSEAIGNVFGGAFSIPPIPTNLEIDKRAFAFGFNLDNAVYKSANSKWQTGKNIDWTIDDQQETSEQKKFADGGESISGTKFSPPPERRRKILQISQLAMYWDDSPPLLLSESSLLKYLNPQLSEHKVLTIIRTAMKHMKNHQDPGSTLRDLLESEDPSMRKVSSKIVANKEHTYVLKKTELQFRLEFDLFEDNRPNRCYIDILPCQVDLSFCPSQLRQRRLLEYTMMGQRRLDTMLHQRPLRRPTEVPRAWWKYAISCVITCPDRRPWRDVKAITAKRAEYISLVEKKHLKKRLEQDERDVLLRLETMLPIETLLAFHLLALRNVVEKRASAASPRKDRNRSEYEQSGEGCVSSTNISISEAGDSMRQNTISGGWKGRAAVTSNPRSDSKIHIDLDQLNPRYPTIPKSPTTKLFQYKERKIKSLGNDRGTPKWHGDEISISPSLASNGVISNNPSTTDLESGGYNRLLESRDEKSPMLIAFHGQEITIRAALLDGCDNDPLLVNNLQFRFSAKTSSANGTCILFDIIRMECNGYVDGTLIKLFTLDLPSSGNEEVEDDDAQDDTSEITLPIELPRSFDKQKYFDDICFEVFDDEVPLFPTGITSRASVTITDRGRSVSFAANSATMIWNTRCIQSFVNSLFPSQTLESRSVLKTQLRNSATPLAQRAQVAMTAPKSLMVKVFIDTPMLWIPVSQDLSNGAFLFHAGKLHLSLSKPELVATMSWIVQSTGTDVRCCASAPSLGNKSHHDSFHDVVLPFDLSVHVDRCGECPDNNMTSNPQRQVHVELSAIVLNLVDIDVLTSAAGKWYASESILLSCSEGEISRNHVNSSFRNANHSVVEQKVHLAIESIDIYMQVENSKQYIRKGHVYMLQIAKIVTNHQKNKNIETFCVKANAMTIRTVSRGLSSEASPESCSICHNILMCNSEEHDAGNGKKLPQTGYAFQIKFVRNILTRLNDVEIMLGLIVLRLTPSILSECYLLGKSIVEKVTIVNKEMIQLLQSRSTNTVERALQDEFPDQPGPKCFGESTTIARLPSSLSNLNNEKFQFTILVNLLADQVIFQLGYDAHQPTDSIDLVERPVIQISAHVLFMFQMLKHFDSLRKAVFHASFDNIWASLIPDFSGVSQRTCEAILNPFAYEFRAVKSSNSIGENDTQEFALDIDTIDVSMAWNDVSYLLEMINDFMVVCSSFEDTSKHNVRNESIIQLCHDRAVTTFNFEFQPWTFTLVSDFGSFRKHPLVTIKGKANGNVKGLPQTMKGEVNIQMHSHLYSKIVDDWVLIMEPLNIIVSLEHDSKKLLNVSINFENTAGMNITNELLEIIAKMTCANAGERTKTLVFQPSQSRNTVKLLNRTGVDFLMSSSHPRNNYSQDNSQELPESIDGTSRIVRNQYCELISDRDNEGQIKLLPLFVGEQKKNLSEYLPILDIPLSSEKGIEVHHLSPNISMSNNKDAKLMFVEPVVEYCIQNQRLRPMINTSQDLDDGTDLLSSQVWSPSDQIYSQGVGNYWSYPYLENDVPEWSDTTFTLKVDKDRHMLPDTRWVWINDWEVDISGEFGKEIDADGWDYATDFRSFTRTKRFFREGDKCRRRKWIRIRMMKMQLVDRIMRPIPIVMRYSAVDSEQQIVMSSHLTITNNCEKELTVFGHKYSWRDDRLLYHLKPGEEFSVPIYVTTITHLRLAIGLGEKGSGFHQYLMSKRCMILPTAGHTCHRLIRTTIYLDSTSTTELYLSARTLHFILTLNYNNSHTHITIDPVFKIRNSLPCLIKYRLLEAAKQVEFDDDSNVNSGGKAGKSEEREIDVGEEAGSLSVDPTLNPSIAFQVPGYQWSSYQRIINRPDSHRSWKVDARDECSDLSSPKPSQSNESLSFHRSLIVFKGLSEKENSLTIVLEVSPSHCPVLTVYAQYWLVDLSGFGLRFRGASSDVIGTVSPDDEVRRTFTKSNNAEGANLHQWCIGKDGMSIFYAKEEKMIVTVDRYKGDATGKPERNIYSKWSNLLDISNVKPKTTFTVDEVTSPRQYEFCYDVSNALGFHQTRIVRIYSRFHVMNLSRKVLYISQEGCLNEITFIPPCSSVPFHWEDSSAPFSIKLSTNCVNWSIGSIRLDKVGITSIKLHDISEVSPVLQVEVRLASKDQNAAFVVLVWISEDNPLYLLKNASSYNIKCFQQRRDESEDDRSSFDDGVKAISSSLGCGSSSQLLDISDFISDVNCALLAKNDAIVGNSCEWLLEKDEEKLFGYDDPQKAHVLEWTVLGVGMNHTAKIDIDKIGSSSITELPDGVTVGCFVFVENSTKVIEFRNIPKKDGNVMSLIQKKVQHNSTLSRQLEDNSDQGLPYKLSFTLDISLTHFTLSVIDTRNDAQAWREIFLLSLERVKLHLSKNRGHDEIELKISDIQVDNYVHNATHEVMISSLITPNEPVFHVSAIRKSSDIKSSQVYRYVAIRLLDLTIMLDRRTVETIMDFLESIQSYQNPTGFEMKSWIVQFTNDISQDQSGGMLSVSDYKINHDRLYIEELHLHPARITLTFTQDWGIDSITTHSPPLLQYMRIIPSISNASLIFTSFVVSHAFESPAVLKDIIATHYASQVTQHVFSLIGSLAIFTGPADFLANIGTGVRDFFYEPINGLVHGPAEFLEGLETGSFSLARGVFLGVVRGASNITELLNSSLVNLTDKHFIEERNTYNRSIDDLTRVSNGSKSISDILTLAGGSLIHGMKSGAVGLYEEPLNNFNKSGAAGLVKGLGHALVSAVIKPLVGFGDGAILVMQHVSSSNDEKHAILHKRIRRALSRVRKSDKNSICLAPYDEISAFVQKLVTGNGNDGDIYLGHLYTDSHLFVATDQFLWIILRRTNTQERLPWEEVSHCYTTKDKYMYIFVFTQKGLTSRIIEVETPKMLESFYYLLSIKREQMTNSLVWSCDSESNDFIGNVTNFNLAGVKTKQVRHIFGSINFQDTYRNREFEDEIHIVEDCYHRVKLLSSDSSTYFLSLDKEAWKLISSWTRMFSGINVKHCLVAGFINATDDYIQVKSALLHEGGSPCCHIPSRDYDELNNILQPGSAIIFFAWGLPPSLEQEGRIFLEIETNLFVCRLLDKKSPFTRVLGFDGRKRDYIFLEKSVSDWWAKYWILIK